MRVLLACFFLLLPPVALAQNQANQLAFLDEVDLYYPSKTFPKLVTPQWVGEPGVEAVVILAIDDMRDSKRYETYLRPILKRLQAIDGRAPVSIMTNGAKPDDPQLQTWLKEGLSLDCHTIDHPCPYFRIGFDKARATYHGCVDMMNAIPNNQAVAFRMPCCDSLNTPSPRFNAEIFNNTSAKGGYLSIDSSVFMVYTSADPALPSNLVLNKEGKERFKRYFPPDRSFVNYIENYPYPYVIGKLCWQFPCMTPSDWQANHVQKPNNPQTVQDWKAAIDCTVIKQGVFTMVFHPHGWIRNEQIVELIDHAVQKHGKKVKFLTFKEALERLNKNLLAGQPLRHPKTGADNGVRLVDLNGDGYLDVVFGPTTLKTQLWSPTQRIWVSGPFAPKESEHLFRGGSREMRLCLRDLDGDGRCEMMKRTDKQEIFRWREDAKIWAKLPFTLPPGARLPTRPDQDHGLRFVDLNGDGQLDVVFANETDFGIYLFQDMKSGWSRKVLAGKRTDKNALPMISRNGTNNGFWVHSGHMWWSNEDTALLKDHVDRRLIRELLAGAAGQK